MTRRLMCVFVFMFTVLACHSAISQDFDMTRPATIKGQVAGMIFGPSDSYLLIDVNDTSGKSQRWAVKGHGLAVLARDGWSPQGTVRPGEAVSVVTFPPKSSANLVESLGSVSDPKLVELVKTGHVLLGTEVTLADGKRLPFGSNN